MYIRVFVVRPSLKFSNVFFSEAIMSILSIFPLKHLGKGTNILVFRSSRIQLGLQLQLKVPIVFNGKFIMGKLEV